MSSEQSHSEAREETVLTGRGVSQGLAFGNIHVNARGFSAPEIYSVDDVVSEQKRFADALEETKKQLVQIQSKVEEISGDSGSQIFEAHILLLEDNALTDKVDAMIVDRSVNAEYCFYAVIQGYMEAMRRVRDSYLAERAIDLEDISMRLLDNLLKNAQRDESPEEDHVLVAYDLTPSDTVSMDRQKMLGFATEQGSYTSHTAILARSLGIPAVVGISDAVMKVRGLAPCILDGTRGVLILDPKDETIAHYRKLYRDQERLLAKLRLESEEESITVDGRKIVLSANVEFEYEIDEIENNGASGIGLYRTEFYLLENSEVPDEDQQAELYSSVTKRVSPHLTIFRTLDSGGDKMSGEPLLEPEPNPFLGWRGIRYSLDRPEVFKAQLRALLRATPHGEVGIMFPMISHLSEIQKAKAMLEDCRTALINEGHEISSDYLVGAMIEVPSAAILAEDLAKEVDFFSIGTNDLVQYTTAVDRVNSRVAHLYRPADPAVLRLIQSTVKGGASSGIWTGVCGEVAGDLELLPLLIGVGIQELSVGVHKVPTVKSALRRLSYTECAVMVEKALKCSRACDIRELSKDIAQRAYPELLPTTRTSRT